MRASFNSAHRYIIAFFSTLLLLAMVTPVIVLVVDPLWLRDHDGWYNRFQPTYDERLTKTMKLVYGVPEGSYDSLLLGSSRAAYLPTNRFRGLHAFNFAVSSLYPGEYLEMLKLFVEEQGEPKTIIIGADFFGTRNDWEDRIGPYLRDARSKSFLLPKIFSLDTLERSFHTVMLNASGKHPRAGDEGYDRRLTKAFYRGPQHNPYYKPMLRKYCTVVYGPSYTWNSDLPEIYSQVANSFPDTSFVIYTSPTTGVLYDALIHSGRFDDYARWLTLLVETFGEVRDLMGHNAFTDNPDNYYDYHHFSAEGGGWLVEYALEAQEPSIGARVTPATLKSYLEHKRAEAQVILTDRPNPCAEFQ